MCKPLYPYPSGRMAVAVDLRMIPAFEVTESHSVRKGKEKLAAGHVS